MSTNPLVAGPVNTTTALSGTGLLEDLSGTAKAIENKDWVGAALSGFATAMDTVAAAIDPIGTLIAWGAGWLMDHLEPLKGWLNDLTGDAGAVAGFAQTWINVGTRMSQEATFLVNRVDAEVGDLKGAAADAYRTYAGDLAKHIGAMQEASNAVASGLQTASTIVQVVHDLVRDTLAQIVGTLASAIIQAVCSAGLLIPKVVADVSTRVASLSGKIGRTVKAVVEALGKLKTLIKKLGDAMDKLKSLFRKADDLPGGPRPKGGDGPTFRDPDTPPTRTNANDPGAPRSRDEVPDCGDPVDVATGRVVMDQTDVELAGALPVVLTRRYVSGYRHPASSAPVGWFGDGWFSLFDERLVVDETGVLYVRADGTHLSYPAPVLGGKPSLPTSGTFRWPLTWDADGYRLHDPLTGQTRTFDELVTTDDASRETVAVLSRVTDAAGRWTLLARDITGAPTGLSTSGGYAVIVSTDAGRITALTVANRGQDVTVARFAYGTGLLTEVRRGAADVPTRFAYDEQARLESWVDTNDVRYAYAYDERGRCVWQSSPAGELAYTYDYSGHDRADRRDPDTGLRQTVAYDSLGHRRRFVITDTGRLAAEVDPLGARTIYEYDELGRRISVTDPLGHRTRFAFDEAGRTTSVGYADGSRISVSFDPAGNPASITGRDGGTWRYTFDGQRLPLTESDPIGATTTYAYDDRGALASVTAADGTATLVTCDSTGLPLRVVDAVGGESRYVRDGFGRITARTDQLGSTTRYAWDTAGRMIRRVAADSGETVWEYDGEGNLLTHTDAAGRTTTMTYAGFDLLASHTSPEGARTTYDWDSELRLVGVTNPAGDRWTYARDAAGRVVGETDYSGRRVELALDAVGNVVSRRNGVGQTVAYTYDELSRLVAKESGDGVRTTYEHDRADRLVRAVHDGVALNREYDAAGHLVAETVDGRTTRWTHDPLGRVTSQATPSGAEIRWERDGVGAVRSMTTAGHRVDLERDEAGRETMRSIDTGLVVTSAWDVMDRLVSRATSGIGGSRRLDYAWPPTSELLSQVDSSRGTTRYALDPAGRVTGVLGADEDREEYAYDSFGDITTASWAGSVVADARGERVYRGTLLAAAGRDRFSYDGESRLVGRTRSLLSGGSREWRFAWDAEDRLTSAVTPDGTQWRYRYDALGRRVAKERLDGSGAVVEQTRFAWDAYTLVEQTTSSVGPAVSTTWGHLGTTPVVQTRSEWSQEQVDAEFYAIVTDMVGTPVELVGESGESVWRSSATLWGLERSASELMPLRFPGQYADAESGLHYNVFRYYDPSTGRYATTDPLGLVPQRNPWTYPRNPHTLVDPLGLTPCTPDPSRSAAFNQAKRDLGIPRSQQPDSVETVPMTDRNGHQVLGPDHQPINTREYHYTTPSGEHVVIQDHGAGHQFNEGGVGDQGPHFNVRPHDDTRGGQVPGTQSHYPFAR